MATLILPLLLIFGLQGYALTATYDMNQLQSLPDETGDICQDCTQIVTLLVDMLSNADLLKRIMAGIDGLCAHLPGPAAKLCKEEVDKALPLAITFVTGVVKPAEVCKLIGLCGSDEERQKMLSYFVNEVLQAAVKREPATHCSFCIFLFKTLEEMLPKERTEGAVIKLLEEICHILPAAHRHQCEDVIGRFSKTVLDAILGYATPQAICALIHQCKGQEPLVDPCTLTTYRCRDVSTALKCGTLFYCQKFAWKPLNYNTI